jgi:putative flavoprotein involved in K+ transport
MAQRVETLIVGAGQAGLAMSYHLRELRQDHIILERGRIAERWRSDRWDSLAFQLPNWMIRLPGFSYEGNDPDGFMPRDDVVRFIEEYSRRIAPPVRCGIRVTGLDRSETNRLLVTTDNFNWEASNVIVATGPYQEPSIPSFGASLPLEIYQLAANRYTNPRQLPPGCALVVGSGGSGCQIASELVRTGKGVYLAVGRHRIVPRRYRGKDYGWWSEKMGHQELTVGEVRPGLGPLLLTGSNGGEDVDLRRLAVEGVTLVGKLQGSSDGRLHFADDLEENLALADEWFNEFTQSVDQYIVQRSIDAPEEVWSDQRVGATSIASSPIRELDLKAAGITSVIWATGYRYDFSWIKSPVLNANGIPVHKRGVTDVAGLYFLGLPRLYKRKSAFLWGVGEDAAYLAQHITARSRPSG